VVGPNGDKFCCHAGLTKASPSVNAPRNGPRGRARPRPRPWRGGS